MSISYLKLTGVDPLHTLRCVQSSLIIRLRVTDAQKVGEGLCGANRKADLIRHCPCRRVRAARTRRGLPAFGRSW